MLVTLLLRLFRSSRFSPIFNHPVNNNDDQDNRPNTNDSEEQILQKIPAAKNGRFKFIANTGSFVGLFNMLSVKSNIQRTVGNLLVQVI